MYIFLVDIFLSTLQPIILHFIYWYIPSLTDFFNQAVTFFLLVFRVYKKLYISSCFKLNFNIVHLLHNSEENIFMFFYARLSDNLLK